MHRDRHWFAGVDPQDSDLPPALVGALAKVGAGGTAHCRIGTPAGTLTARIVASSDALAEGYLAILAALKQGIARQADFAPLVALTEPYARPHDDDAAFYAPPRIVDHLDTTALEQWRELTGCFVSDGMVVLDLMASHDSHLPDGARPARLAGLGMNAVELAHNGQLTERIVHDLNIDTTLPFASGTFDVVLCALSIEYLARPEAVLHEVARVLKPGGTCMVSFSERWFPPKAVNPWPTLHPFARVAWVLRHLQRTGFNNLHTESLRGLPRPADDKHIAQTRFSDPRYAIWGTR
jgi:SAM-dependent methyltransferase